MTMSSSLPPATLSPPSASPVSSVSPASPVSSVSSVSPVSSVSSVSLVSPVSSASLLRPAVITGAARATPSSRSQEELWTAYFARHFAGQRWAHRVFSAAGVDRRHHAVDPTIEDVSEWSTGARMERYLVEAMPLARSAVSGALAEAGLAPADVGLLAVVSCTGYATPGVDIRLARDLAMDSSTQRLFIGHMGCYAALPALGAVSDYVVARGRPAVLLCIELSSLHLQPPTDDLEQVVAHSLFSDAAGAVVVEPAGAAKSSVAFPALRAAPAGSLGSASLSSAAAAASLADPASLESAASLGSAASLADPASLADAGGNGAGGSVPPPLTIVDVAARTDAATADHMTWDVTDLGFRMGLSRRVPDVLARHVRPLVDSLLAAHGISIDQVEGWAVHPGGPSILDVIADELDLPADALQESRQILAEDGNCSSATVLLVLDRIRRRRPLAPGSFVVALAFGPGLTLYAVLLQA
jgi:alkylresorcinol/alkylpyrone synthase